MWRPSGTDGRTTQPTHLSSLGLPYIFLESSATLTLPFFCHTRLPAEHRAPSASSVCRGSLPLPIPRFYPAPLVTRLPPSLHHLPFCDLHATHARHCSHRRRGRPQRLRRGKDGPSLDLRASPPPLPPPPPLTPPHLDLRASSPPPVVAAMDRGTWWWLGFRRAFESLFITRVATSVLDVSTDDFQMLQWGFLGHCNRCFCNVVVLLLEML